MFKLWSETSTLIEKELKPDLWIKNWSIISNEEKKKIWKYLEDFFFNYETLILNIKNRHQFPLHNDVFSNKYIYPHLLKNNIENTINYLNEKCKQKSYADKYLENWDSLSACLDFYNIFQNNDENIVLELLSIYSKFIIDLENNYFIKFSKRLNEVFNDFWLNIILTEQWFIPKQWEKIIEEIFKPTLDFLSDKKFKEVNRDLWDAFDDYHKKDYSWSITKTISAIQAFLQINVNGEIWKGDISKLIPEAISKKIIPEDIFTKTIFDNLESIIQRERKETWDSHPKKEYANEQNARLILNLAMVFIQHFIQIKKK